MADEGCALYIAALRADDFDAVRGAVDAAAVARRALGAEEGAGPYRLDVARFEFSSAGDRAAAKEAVSAAHGPGQVALYAFSTEADRAAATAAGEYVGALAADAPGRPFETHAFRYYDAAEIDELGRAMVAAGEVPPPAP